MPFKVTDVGTNQELVCDFLLVNKLMPTNLHPNSHRSKILWIIGKNFAFDRGRGTSVQRTRSGDTLNLRSHNLDMLNRLGVDRQCDKYMKMDGQNGVQQ